MTPDTMAIPDEQKPDYKVLIKKALEVKAAKAQELHNLGLRPPVMWPRSILTRVAEIVPMADITALAAALTAPPPSTALLSDSAQILSDTLKQLAFTANHLNAGGMAAPQLGVGLRVFVVRVTREDGSVDTVGIINPTLADVRGEQESNEGCLSIPGERFTVQRPGFVRVTGWGGDGEPIEIGGDGILACVLQHELDHLNGKLLVDSVSHLKRSLIRRRLVKAYPLH